MIARIGFCLVLAGLALAAYWVLFMSWSHSFLSPAFQHRQTLVLSAALAAGLAGITLVAMAWHRRRGSRRAPRSNEEQR